MSLNENMLWMKYGLAVQEDEFPATYHDPSYTSSKSTTPLSEYIITLSLSRLLASWRVYIASACFDLSSGNGVVPVMLFCSVSDAMQHCLRKQC